MPRGGLGGCENRGAWSVAGEGTSRIVAYGRYVETQSEFLLNTNTIGLPVRIWIIRPPTDNERAPITPTSEMNALTSAIGASLRDARVRAGLSLHELALRSQGRYSPSSLGGYERGERAISVVRFCELARFLGVPADQLLGRALDRVMSDERREVVLELTDLPDSEVGRQTAAHAHHMKERRSDYLSTVVTLRSGDLQVIADASGLDVPTLLSSLGEAVKRVGPR